VYAISIADAPTVLPFGSWERHMFPIVPNGDAEAGPGTWFAFGGGSLIGADDGTGFDAAFAGPSTRLRIWGELTKDAPEADGSQLDNVRITVVPVPAALPMMLSAIAGFLAWRRRT
ncbi:MAG: hypothetical protein AAF387_04335, partial [Pseudomonadota bacterium]